MWFQKKSFGKMLKIKQKNKIKDGIERECRCVCVSLCVLFFGHLETGGKRSEIFYSILSHRLTETYL